MTGPVATLSDMAPVPALPARKAEYWQYSGVQRLDLSAFRPAAAGPAVSVDALPAALAVPAPRAVLVNGRFSAALSALDGLPDGVTVRGLAAAPGAGAVSPAPGTLARADASPFVALADAGLDDGVVIDVADGVRMVPPLSVVSLGREVDGPVMFHPRLLVRLGRDAALTLIEHHAGTGACLANHVGEIVLGDGAGLVHARVQTDDEAAGRNMSTLFVEAAARARYDGAALQAGAVLGRHEVHLRLAGEGAEAQLVGIALADAARVADVTAFVTHAVPRCRSRQVFRAVAGDEARAVLQGKVRVDKGADGTDAHQLLRALLLSPRAEADARPELEIYADDVACSHGAAIGDLDADQLFYLAARGIHEAEARRLLVAAFVEQAVDAIPEGAARDAVAAAAHAWLARKAEVGA